MKFDEQYGLPKCNSCDDYKDSAVLGGLMCLFEHPDAPHTGSYLVKSGDKYLPTRHPMYSPDDFSRDQLMPLIAGMWKELGPSKILENYKPTNGDWLSPSHKDHLRRCCGLPDTWLGRMWLWMDVLWACYVDPMAESNQLLSMLLVADRKYLNFYLKHCSKWKDCIRAYWSNTYGSWRGEDEWAEFMIEKLGKI